MADVSSSRPPSSTRQLLDELDALMQRMLSLPVEGGEEAPDSVPSGDSNEPPVPLTPPVALSPVADTAAVPRAASPPATSPPATPPAEPPELPGPRTLAPLGPDLFADLPHISPFPEHLRSYPRRRWRFAPAWQRPLLWLNAAFDWGTRWLGPPGRWLRSRQGRNLLGWLGLAFLALALGWQLLAWLGWEWKFIIP